MCGSSGYFEERLTKLEREDEIDRLLAEVKARRSQPA